MNLPANFRLFRSLAKSILADDTSPAMKIRYIGPAAADPQVVFGTHDFLFYTNYTTGAVLDTEVFQTGVTAGHLETDKAAADMTFGTLAALINASANWRCVLVGARPEDNAYTHSGTLQHLLAFAANSAESLLVPSEHGATVYFDSSTAPYHYTAVIGPESENGTFATFMARVSRPTILDAPRDISDFVNSSGVAIPGAAELSAMAWCNVVDLIEETMTFTTSATIQVYASTQAYSRLILERAGAATTVAGSYDNQGLISEPGERLIVRVTLVGGTFGSTLDPTSLKIRGAVGVLE